MTAEDLARITKLIALVQAGAIELLTMINQIRAQQGQSTEEILADAEAKNAQAKSLIESL